LRLRPYHPTDFTYLYDICLKTGYSGKDATPFYKDPELPGHVYAGPYAAYEPELCFILDHHTRPAGYVLGCSQTEVFARWLNDVWYPLLRERYPVEGSYTELEKRMVHHIHHGYQLRPFLKDYPAHLHIDILPVGQGTGAGRRLLTAFFNALKAKGVPAVHLEVGKSNTHAVGFYRHIGFHIIEEYEQSFALGYTL